jgi:hypothetical protein
MTNTEIASARDISARRIAALQANGEDVRRTVAWRDAVYERGQIERSIAFSRFVAGCSK